MHLYRHQAWKTGLVHVWVGLISVGLCFGLSNISVRFGSVEFQFGLTLDQLIFGLISLSCKNKRLGRKF